MRYVTKLNKINVNLWPNLSAINSLLRGINLKSKGVHLVIREDVVHLVHVTQCQAYEDVGWEMCEMLRSIDD